MIIPNMMGKMFIHVPNHQPDNGMVNLSNLDANFDQFTTCVFRDQHLEVNFGLHRMDLQLHGLSSLPGLVNIQRTMERSTMFNGKINDFNGHVPVRKLQTFIIVTFMACSMICKNPSRAALARSLWR